MAASLQLSACANYSFDGATPKGPAETTILTALEQLPSEAVTFRTPTPFAVNIRNFDVGLDQYCARSRLRWVVPRGIDANFFAHFLTILRRKTCD